MQPRVIALIYFYLISAVALMLFVIGIFQSVSVAVNLLAYDQYPLPYVGQDCNTISPVIPEKAPAPLSAPVTTPTETTPSAQEMLKQKDDCLAAQEQSRKQQKVSDIKSAVTFTLVGLILFLIHFPIARRMTSEKS